LLAAPCDACCEDLLAPSTLFAAPPALCEGRLLLLAAVGPCAGSGRENGVPLRAHARSSSAML
jgi:hypothetical protein